MSGVEVFRLSDDHQALCEAVRAVASDTISPHASDVDEKGVFPQAACDAPRASDFRAPHVPEAYRRGWSRRAGHVPRHRRGRPCLCVVLPDPGGEQARHDALDPRGVTRPPAAQPATGRRRGRHVLLRAVRAGGRIGHGVDVDEGGAGPRRLGADRPEVLDHQCGGVRVLHGDGGDRPGRTQRPQRDRLHAAPRRRGLHDGRARAQARHQGVADPELFFEGVRVGDDCRVGDVGAGLQLALRTLDHTRFTIDAEAVGIAQGALDHAVAYVKERQQFGTAVAEFQGVQLMLADMAIKLEAARHMVYVAAANSEREDADLSFFGAAAKCYASDVAMEITTDAVQPLVGAGYVKDYPVEPFMRDAKITQIYEGTNQVQRVMMARHLLRGRTQ